MTTLFIFDGADTDRAIEFTEPIIHIGRSSENEIQIKDRTVSRRHLKIRKEKKSFFITDLNSRNGTYMNGAYIPPEVEVEAKQGTPVVIGMSVICLGEGCVENVLPFLESIEFSEIADGEMERLARHRKGPGKKNYDLIQKVDSVLMESMDLNDISTKILDYILELFKRVDRGVIFLSSDESEDMPETVISRARRTEATGKISYCREVIDEVISLGKPVYISDAFNRDQEEELSDTLKIMNIRSVICVPLLNRNNKIRGALYVDSGETPHGFRKGDLELLTELAKRASLALENALLYANLAKK
ncbi:MAG: FHA domain-containing protein [Deltaproteobacteria bacterium]|nr:FHA domain-containing protein [Deltaproteobacteria bacterium]